jgi:hypothetical protein
MDPRTSTSIFTLAFLEWGQPTDSCHTSYFPSVFAVETRKVRE